MSATTGQRHFSTVGRDGAHVQRHAALKASSGDGAGSFYIHCIIEVLSMSFQCQWGWSFYSKWCLYTNRSALLLHYNPIWNSSLEGFLYPQVILLGRLHCKTFFICMWAWLLSYLLQDPPENMGFFLDVGRHRPFWGSWIMTQSWWMDGGTQRRHEQVSACCCSRIASMEPLKYLFFFLSCNN